MDFLKLSIICIRGLRREYRYRWWASEVIRIADEDDAELVRDRHVPDDRAYSFYDKSVIQGWVYKAMLIPFSFNPDKHLQSDLP